MSAVVAAGARALRPLGRGAVGAWRLPPGQRVAVLVLCLALLGAGYLWLRGSSLVAVDAITVKGADESPELVEALTAAAQGMSTLDLDRERLEQVAAGYPSVKSIEAETSLPSSVTLTVRLRDPVALTGDADRPVTVAADGTLLPDATAEDLVMLPGASIGAGGPSPEQQIMLSVLGPAPEELLPLISAVTADEIAGPVVTIEPGIELRFSTAERARAKWRAVTAVLADPDLTEAAYIDLTVPDRPAVGGAAGLDSLDSTLSAEPQASPEAAGVDPATG